MNRDARLTFRVRSELKKQLEKIAAQEGRRVAQVCEAFVKAGIQLYDKDGPDYLRALVRRLGVKSSREA